MKIGIILHPYGEEKPGGLARTIFEWTKTLIETDKENEYIIFLKEKPKISPKFSGDNWSLDILGGGRFWLDKLKKRTQADVYIFQTPVLPAFWKPPKSIIITQDYPYKYFKARSVKEYIKHKFIGWYHKRSLKKADSIIAVSEWAKNDNVRFFGINPDKITVIPMGFRNICAEEKEEPIPLPEKFFLFVGVVKERKNFLRILEAFRLFKKEDKDGYKLVVAGKVPEDSYAKKALDFVNKNKLQNDIVFINHVNDGQLAFAYKKAEALLFPSLVESFGFPVLEAMSCGTPVITSNFGGPSETGGNGATLLVDPYNSQEITLAMKNILETERRMEIIDKGKERAKDFSWEKTAYDTVKLFQNL